MNWDYYKPGTVIRRANVKVLELIEQEVLMRKTRYRVRLLCCGDEREMTHERIRLREHNRPERCQACKYEDGGTARSTAAKQNMREAQAESRDLEKQPARYVDWSPPPSALNLPQGWMPR